MLCPLSEQDIALVLAGRMGSGEDAQFVFAKYDYTAQGNQVSSFPWSLNK